MGLINEALAGDRRALARLATLIERDDARSEHIIDGIYSRTGRARTVGITGPPGVGKSTLIAALIETFRREGRRVAVVAVDPTSPISGGAALGDRIRMLRHSGDPGVFVRSVASRGRAGGLAPATSGLIHLFDASGFDVVIVETVGTGQEETEIASYVDTLVLLQPPGAGDSVQFLKAGVLELADIFVVAKSDLPGAATTARILRSSLPPAGDRQWPPPVIAVAARDGTGIDQFAAAIAKHHEWLTGSDALSRKRLSLAAAELKSRTRRLVEERLRQDEAEGEQASLLKKLAARQIAPSVAARTLLAELSLACGEPGDLSGRDRGTDTVVDVDDNKAG
jgi:LAO/AO transport system kinase